MDALVWAAAVLAVIALAYLPVAAAIFASVVGHLLTPGRVDWAALRKPAPSHPLAICYRGVPSTVPGWSYSDVTYSTPLGPAPAWLLHLEGPAGDVWAIFVHGIGGIRENGYRQASVMRELGVPSLLITYRNDPGAPADPGGMHAFGLTEWQDLEAAVDHALANGARRVVLMAESMGGAIVGQFLARSSRAEYVAALVLDAPALDVPAVLIGNLRAFHVPLAARIVERGLGLLLRWRGIELRAARCGYAVSEFEGPVFLAHGTADRLVPVGIGDSTVEQRQDRVTIYVRTDGDHLRSWHRNVEGYRSGMIEVMAAIEPVEQAAA